jgi:hypothetical protein
MPSPVWNRLKQLYHHLTSSISPAESDKSPSNTEVPGPSALPMAPSDKSKVFLGAIDQGTTSSRFLIFDVDGNPVATHQVEFKQIYPQSGYVISSLIVCHG